jgi:hypothetical protein
VLDEGDRVQEAWMISQISLISRPFPPILPHKHPEKINILAVAIHRACVIPENNQENKGNQGVDNSIVNVINLILHNNLVNTESWLSTS